MVKYIYHCTERHDMKYLFFDIEGACPKLSTIATFGYVLADENFSILAKEDILVNPNSKYDWYVLKNLLSYKKAQLANSCLQAVLFICVFTRSNHRYSGKRRVRQPHRLRRPWPPDGSPSYGNHLRRTRLSFS